MKALSYISKKMVVKGILYFFPIMLTLNSYSQYLLKSNVNPPYFPTAFEDENGTLKIGNGKLFIGNGFGLPDPYYAIIHAKSFLNFSSTPLYQTDLYSSGGVLQAGIMNLVKINGINYGIYQSSIQSPTAPVINYLQDPLIVGKVKIFEGLDSNGIISVINPFNKLDFIINPGNPTPDPVTALTINANGIIVRSKVVTERVQILTDPGESKVLVSDRDGNGTWTDPSFFKDDDWLVSTRGGDGIEPPSSSKKSLYFNNSRYKYVGIGTDVPKSLVHVYDGNILLSRRDSTAPEDKKGNILFGNIVSERYPMGEWGIEYYRGGERAASGLNFWKVRTETNDGSDFCLFLQDDGNVGINTPTPEDRFQVNEGCEKLSIGSANSQILFDGSSYIGFNSSRRRENWKISSNGQFNGGTAIFGDLHGNIRFSTIPSLTNGSTDQYVHDIDLANNVKVFIASDSRIGVLTNNPIDNFQINDGWKKLSVGTASNNDLKWGNSYIGFNAARQKENSSWVLGDDGIHNGGGVFWSGMDGSFYIAPIASEENNRGDQILSDADIASRIKITIFTDGRVGINTSPQSGYHLSVNGKVLCTELKVMLEEDWGDYVFDQSYKLMPLSEVTAFIKNNHHLPEIPSAKEIKENGLNMGEMSALLMKKIEELTLYIIDQQKQIDQLTVELKKK